MIRRILLPRSLSLAASLVSCWALGSLSSDLSTRHSMTFTGKERTVKTVIGYIETPGDDPPRITDVEHIEYPDGTSDHLAFTILADKDVLEEFNREQIQRMLKSNDPRARSPASLRALLMRNFGSEALKKYEQRFASYDDLYCMVDAVSTGHRHGSQFSINYALYLSRTQANGAFTLRAMKTDLAVEHGRAGWALDPKFYVDRLNDLLSRSEKATPRGDDTPRSTCERQVWFYSNYISPPEHNIFPDTWPEQTFTQWARSSFPILLADHTKNIFHWLTNGTIKYKH